MLPVEIKVLYEALPHSAHELVRTVRSIAHRNLSVVFVFRFDSGQVICGLPLSVALAVHLEIFSVVYLYCVASTMKLYLSYPRLGFSGELCHP